jgi:hypothetical protein
MYLLWAPGLMFSLNKKNITVLWGCRGVKEGGPGVYYLWWGNVRRSIVYHSVTRSTLNSTRLHENTAKNVLSPPAYLSLEIQYSKHKPVLV